MNGQSPTEIVMPYITSGAIPGAVTLVTDADGVLDISAMGYADLEARKPMPDDAIFWTASTTKAVTAIALMMLVDEGLVDLDIPVTTWLSDFQPPIMHVGEDGQSVVLAPPKTAMTLRHLLSHTAGVPFTTSVESEGADRWSLVTRVSSYSLTPLQFEPGAGFLYSSAGFNIVGRVIEIVSNVAYETFLKERLFLPMGMNDTDFWLSTAQEARLARPYVVDKNQLRNTEIIRLHTPFHDRRGRFAFPGGGLFSTARDLGELCRMILGDGVHNGHRYLSISAIDEMSKNQLTADNERKARLPVGYGLGWNTTGLGRIGHGGAFGTNMTIDRTLGIAIVWMMQADDVAARSISARIEFEESAFQHFGHVRN